MKISVIIPTCNRPTLLQKAVASVLAQDYQDLELLIVNDGASSVPDFADQRIRVISSGQAGAVPARNLGTNLATGDMIAWLDDDDQWTDKTFMSRAARELSRGAGFIHADGRFVFTDGTPPRPYSRTANAATLEKDNTILVSAMCYRARLHHELGPFATSLPYYWDWDWFLRVARAGVIMHHMRRPVVDILIHPENMSTDANTDARRENLIRLAEKHGLAPLKPKTHRDLA